MARIRRISEQFARGQRLAPGNGELAAATATGEMRLGRWNAAVEHSRRAERLDPRSVARDAVDGAYVQQLLARIYILLGEPEKALDQLEPLLKIPGYLSPGWLKIDPNFDPLRRNPRFQKLVAGR